jgi:hypothetical protein
MVRKVGGEGHGETEKEGGSQVLPLAPTFWHPAVPPVIGESNSGNPSKKLQLSPENKQLFFLAIVYFGLIVV